MQQIKTKKTRFFTASRMSVIAVFAALAGVLQLLRIPMPFAFPVWLELNFADIPTLIGTFALGPLSGSIIVTVKILLKLIINGTDTFFIGDLADLIIGLALVIPAGLVYKKYRTLKGAAAAMAIGSLCSTAVAVAANRVLLIPFYADQMGIDALVSMMTGLFPACTAENFYGYYLWISVLPFNLMRCLIACAVTFPIYKRISALIKRMCDRFDPPEHTGTTEACDGNRSGTVKRTVIVAGVTLAVFAVLIAAVLLRYFL